MLQMIPTLPGCGVDDLRTSFMMRSLDAICAWRVRQTQQYLRDDLPLRCLMSATIDAERRLAAWLDDAPMISQSGAASIL